MKDSTQDILLVVSLIAYQMHTINVTRYAFQVLHHNFPVPIDLTKEWSNNLVQSKYTILDCLISWATGKKFTENYETFMNGMRVTWVPYCTRPDLEKNARELKYVEVIFFVGMIIHSFALVLSIPLLAAIYMWQTHCQLISFQMARAFFDIVTIFFNTAYVGDMSPSILVLLFYLFTKILFNPYNRMLKNLKKHLKQQNNLNTIQQQKMVISRLVSAKRIFVYSLKTLRDIDEKGCQTVFAYSVTLTLLAGKYCFTRE